MAVGDGANDLFMMAATGTSVAYTRQAGDSEQGKFMRFSSAVLTDLSLYPPAVLRQTRWRFEKAQRASRSRLISSINNFAPVGIVLDLPPEMSPAKQSRKKALATDSDPARADAVR